MIMARVELILQQTIFVIKINMESDYLLYRLQLHSMPAVRSYHIAIIVKIEIKFLMATLSKLYYCKSVYIQISKVAI